MTPLKDVRVLLVGMGGLGCPVGLALAQSGIGTLGLCDDDLVDLSNLHRQILYRDGDVGARKAVAAATALAAAAPGLRVLPFPARFSIDLAEKLLPQFDIVVDGSDNFATKFLVNDACVLSQKPFVIAAAVRWSGQVLAWQPDAGAGCYRCLFEAPPPAGSVPSCQQAGILGAVCGVVGALAAAATLALAGHPPASGAPRPGQLYLYEALAGSLRKIALRKNQECAVCSRRATIHELSASHYLEEESR